MDGNAICHFDQPHHRRRWIETERLPREVFAAYESEKHRSKPIGVMKICTTLCVFTLSVFVLPLAAQQLREERITIEDGLSQGMVRDILQDSRGLMWFSTKDGLNRYDGYEFKVYSHLPFDPFSVSGHVITTLLEDPSGRLWVGTENNGLNVFDPATEKFWHIHQKTDQQPGLSSNTILSLELGKAGSIWVGTSLGLDHLTLPSDFDFADFKHSPDLNAGLRFVNYQYAGRPFAVHGIYVDEGKIFIGGASRFFVLNLSGKQQIIEKTAEFLSPKVSHLYFEISSIIKLPDGSMLFSDLHELVRLQDERIIRYTLPTRLSRAPELLADQSGNIWCASTQLFKFHPARKGQDAFEVVLQNENRPVITAILADRSNILWMGTNGYGIIKYNPNAQHFRHFLNGPVSSTRQLYIDQQNRYWLWHYSFSLECIDPVSGALYFPEGFPAELRVARWVLQSKKNGAYWFHFPFSDRETKLVRYDPLSGELNDFVYDCPTHPLSPMVEDADGNIWFSCKRGQLVKWDEAQGAFFYYPFAQQLHPDFAEADVTALIYAEGGVFWIGTPHGLVRFEPGNATEPWKTYRHDSEKAGSLSDNYILSIHASKTQNEVLWIGTKGGGLNRFDIPSAQFTVLNTSHGLPNNVVYGILEEQNGALWLSTNGGLSQYQPATGVFRNYTYFDGLQSNEFNSFSYAQAEDGTLFFGGINGVNVFHPDSLKQNQRQHEVFFTEIRVNNRVFSPLYFQKEQSPVQFEHTENLFHFKFAVADYTNAGKNTFRFQMEGIDAAPIFLGHQRDVVFAQLSPGAYKLKIWEANNNGIWSEPAEWSFTILPPWYQTPAAYAAGTVLLAVLFLMVWRFQVNRIRLRNQMEFERREAERQAALNRIKGNFFSNITHEFRTPLTLILEPARQLFQHAKWSNDQQELLRIIVNNGQNLLQLINQLLDLSKVEGGFMKKQVHRGDLIATLQEVYRQFLPIAEKEKIQLQFRSSHSAYETLFDQEKTEKCLNNLMANAIKFTPAGGKVALNVRIEQDAQQSRAHIELSDTGIGIAPEDLPFIFDRYYQAEADSARVQKGTGIGLSLVKELVRLMDGDIRVESQPGQGTVFTLLLPLGRAEAQTVPPSPLFLSPEPDVLLPDPLEQATATGTKPVILVVEDNADLRQFLVQTLKSNYRVLTAVNGEEGWQKARIHLPDVIVSDIMMPIKSGLDLLKLIKEEPLTASIPVVLLTAKSSGSNKVAGIKAGADAYIAKPFETEELLVKIAQLIAQREKLRVLYGQHAKDEIPTSSPMHAEWSGTDDFIKKFTFVLEEHLDNETLSVEMLAREMNLSRSQLHRKVKHLTNQSVTEMLRNYRLDRAMALLKNQHDSVGQVAASVGFSNQQYFATIFKKRFGCSPSEVATSNHGLPQL